MDHYRDGSMSFEISKATAEEKPDLFVTKAVLQNFLMLREIC